MRKVRTRLAPSPTGFIHIGTVRTALFGYLFTRHNKGDFILRIEDTDQNRLVEGAADAIYDGMKWIGMTFDEGPKEGGDYGPYVQTERSERHIEAANELLEKGKAYRCFCTKERLTELREMQVKHKLPPTYDRKCRSMTEAEVETELSNNTPYTVRLKMPLDGDVVCEDIVRGKVKYPAKDLADAILLKSDGLATYHLAAMVDDHDMEISHVIRTEEWLPSLPIHFQVFEAFGWERPEFAHLPLVLNEDRTKMSKRKGDVYLESYIKKGYLRDALVNYLALLGWTGPNDREIWTMDELIEEFDLNKVHKAGAIFKIDKLNWFNGHYIREKSPEELAELLIEHCSAFEGLQTDGDTITLTQPVEGSVSKERFILMVKHAQSRLTILSEFLERIAFYFEKELSYDVDLLTNEKMKADKEVALQGLQLAKNIVSNIENFSADTIKEAMLPAIAETGLKNGQVLWPMRAALSGKEQSPGAFEVAEVFGKEECLQRLDHGIALLSSS